MKVLRVLGTPKGFSFIPIHWSHDPEKTQAWADASRASYPRPEDWDREMEIDFSLQTGAPAYPKWSDAKHLAEGLWSTYDERLPLHVGLDFNVDPMSMVIDQVHWEKKRIHVIHEIVKPVTIDELVLEFRKLFSGHRADVKIYGDATKGTTPQTAQSNWDTVRLAFRGYHINPEFLVPNANPNIGDRLNAVNLKLMGQEWAVLVDPDTCPEFVMDMREVVLTDDRKKIKKVNDKKDPYYYRTHPSDAWGYRISFAFSVVDDVVRDMAKKREPMVPKTSFGEGGLGKRKPLDKSRAR